MCDLEHFSTIFFRTTLYGYSTIWIKKRLSLCKCVGVKMLRFKVTMFKIPLITNQIVGNTDHIQNQTLWYYEKNNAWWSKGFVKHFNTKILPTKKQINLEPMEAKGAVVWKVL